MKKEFCIIFGGRSYEHEISIVSAITIKKFIKIKYFIFLDQDRNLYLINDKNMVAKHFSSMAFKNDSSVILKNGGFFKKTLFSYEKLDECVAINMVHGGDGEDGILSSLFDFYSIKYIGPRKEACMFSFDKHLTKLYANSVGAKTTPYSLVNRQNRNIDIDISYPLIVKPLKLGSSIGISIVDSKDELDYALDVAFEFDDGALIEPFIKNIKEYNMAGYKTNKIYHSIIEEPKKSEFLDFNKKYLDFSRDSKIDEANLDDGLKDELKAVFDRVYGSLFDGSIIRCDFFIHESKIFLNEINPIPGSLANYLFDDIKSIMYDICDYLPKNRDIKVSYEYISKINSSKGS